MSYAGFYINLDRRADRRAGIEAELNRFGLLPRYARFSAVEGNALGFDNPHLKAGEMGCFSSHYMLLKQNLGRREALHIIEDDVLLSASTEPVLRGIIEQDLFAGCDIVYTDIFVAVQNAAYKAYKQFFDQTASRDGSGRVTHRNFNIFGLKDLPFGSTTSYLVHPGSIGKLHDLYEREISHQPRHPNDLCVREWCQNGALKAGCVMPFVTSVQLDHIVETDIDRGYHQMSALVAHLGRYSFFIDADLALCQKYIDTHLSLPEQDEHRRILTQLLGFSLTDHYRRL